MHFVHFIVVNSSKNDCLFLSLYTIIIVVVVVVVINVAIVIIIIIICFEYVLRSLKLLSIVAVEAPGQGKKTAFICKSAET